MPLFANYNAEFAFLHNSMKCCCKGLPLPHFSELKKYPSYYNTKAAELLTLHKVKIHKTLNFPITELGA